MQVTKKREGKLEIILSFFLFFSVLNVDDLCVAVTHNAVIQIDDIFPRLELSHPQFVQYYKELSK
jgi:hypothetical protein